MEIDRRSFMGSTLGAGVLAVTSGNPAAAAPPTLVDNAEFDAAASTPVLKLDALTAPVTIESIELLQVGDQYFTRIRSRDGAVGIALITGHAQNFHSIFHNVVAPYFVKRDARDLEKILDEICLKQYKMVGFALANCLGWIDTCLLDLLGKVSGKPAGELLGGVLRQEIPVYMSSMRRDTTPEQEVENVARRLQETGATAVKLKIGGRMSRNADASPGRTDKLIPLARKTLGDSIAIYTDANGSYDAPKAIEVGRMLEDNRVGFYEEPCFFQDFESTKEVADALTVPIAGGEQDSSVPLFRWMIRHHAFDLVQPDLHYNGGFIRTIRVARMAAKAGTPITPHSSKQGLGAIHMLQFASCTPNIGPHQEYEISPPDDEPWYTPQFRVEKGVVRVPTGSGLGVEIDPDFLRAATPVGTPRVS